MYLSITIVGEIGLFEQSAVELLQLYRKLSIN